MKSWLPFLKEIEPEIKLLVCDQCTDDSEYRNTGFSWPEEARIIHFATSCTGFASDYRSCSKAVTRESATPHSPLIARRGAIFMNERFEDIPTPQKPNNKL